jgi:hypothetical protein
MMVLWTRKMTQENTDVAYLAWTREPCIILCCLNRMEYPTLQDRIKVSGSQYFFLQSEPGKQLYWRTNVKESRPNEGCWSERFRGHKAINKSV